MIKDILLFPFNGVYKYVIKIQESYRVDEEIALIMKLNLIFISMILVVSPLSVLLLLIGNTLNIPLVLWLGGKGNMWKISKKVTNNNYEDSKISKVGEDTLEIDVNSITETSNTTINDKYFDENASVINKMSSILRFGVIDGLKKIIKEPKGMLQAGLERLFKEDEIEYVRPDIFDDGTENENIDINEDTTTQKQISTDNMKIGTEPKYDYIEGIDSEDVINCRDVNNSESEIDDEDPMSKFARSFGESSDDDEDDDF